MKANPVINELFHEVQKYLQSDSMLASAMAYMIGRLPDFDGLTQQRLEEIVIESLHYGLQNF